MASMLGDLVKTHKDSILEDTKKNVIETDLLDLLKICAANEDEQIYINSPFVFKPSVNLKPLDQRIN